MEKCPHGYAPPPSAYPRRGGSVPIENGARVRIIRDSRDCPECLHIRVEEADAILNRIFNASGVMNAEIYDLWIKYVTRYNP